MASEVKTPPLAIPLCAPMLHGNEWAYLRECLETNWVSTAGPFVTRFEQGIATQLGARHAVACSSGTAALHLALLVAGIQPDQEVVVPALTFIAPANAVRYAGAYPVFVDVDPQYWQIDVERLVDFIGSAYAYREGALQNRLTGRRLTAIVTVDLLGHPADDDGIDAIAKKYGLRVIEDATESLGASYKSRPVGALADVGCLSFNGNKVVTSGGGGMLVTDNEDWAARARYLSTQAKDDPIEQTHGSIGYNYRLTNLQAALGVAQLEVLDHHVAAKRRIASAYRERLAALPGVSFQQEAPWARSIFWMTTVAIDGAKAGVDSRSLIHRLMSRGIECRPLWQPLHLSGAHRGAFAAPCDVAESIAARAVSLPSSVGLTPSEQDDVVSEIAAAFNQR